MISISSPVTGAPVSGLTSPTTTWVASTPPGSNMKSWAVSSIGGTQTGSDTGSTASRPWTITFGRPTSLRQLNAVDSSGVLRVVPFNTYTVVGRKGLTPLAGQASKTSIIRTEVPIPAGADTADQPNIKSMLSAYFGVCYQQATGLADTCITGEL